MPCTCESILCEQIEIEGVIYCQCETIIDNITCPPGCMPIIENDNIRCSCIDSVTPIISGVKEPVYFDDDEFFEDLSWTIAYKPSEGSWSSYFSFYPDYSLSHNGYFQIGYNWGRHKETTWNHLLSKGSFCVFQGEKHNPIVEFPVVSENVNKLLNSISLNIEPTHYSSEWNWTIDKDKSFKNLYIYNKTNNSGMLGLKPQKTLSDVRKYPQTNGNTQEILFTSNEDKQNVNYFYNRIVSQDNNIPMFNVDSNNIFKTINTNAVKFSGKKVLERLKGDSFIIHLEGLMDTRFNLILKNIINDESIY